MSPVTSASLVIYHSVSAASISFAAVRDANLSIIDVSGIVLLIRRAQCHSPDDPDRLLLITNLSPVFDDEGGAGSVLIRGHRETNDGRI